MKQTAKGCIWYISKYVCPDGYDGTGTRGFLLMHHMANMGYKSVILTSNSNHLIKNIPNFHGTAYIENIDKVDIHWIKTIQYLKTNSFYRILSWIDFEFKLFFYNKKKIQKPDIIIVSSLSLLTIINGIFFKIFYRSKLVFEIRDIWPLTIIEEGKFSRFNPFVLILNIIERFGYFFSDRIIGTMPNLGQHLGNLGINKKAYCIPMGIDEKNFKNMKKLPQSYIKRYIPTDRFIVMHAGSVGITNALDTLLECANKLIDHKKIHFVIVGEGDLISKYTKDYNHLENLTFAPRVEKKMVQDLLSYSNILYFSAYKSKVWRYGQSLNKIIDYMYAGKPIIGSYSGYPSMINEAECGKFIEPECVNTLKREILEISDKKDDELNIMGQNGKSWLLMNRKYNKLAEEYIDIILKNND